MTNKTKPQTTNPENFKQIQQKSIVKDLIGALICLFTTTVFTIVPIILLSISGAIKFQISKGVWFIIFIAICSICAGFVLYYNLYKKKNRNLQSLYDALDKLSKGEYDFDLSSLPLEFKDIGEKLTILSKRLKLFEQEKDDFINDFSHELKTPIVSIRGFARLIAKGNLSPDEQAEYLAIILSESDRLIELTASTLMIDRLSSNKFDIETRKYNLSEQIRKTILLLQTEWEKKNIEFIADFEDYDTVSNEELVSRLLLNVIQNAIKFSLPNGKIEVIVKAIDNEISVTVKDYGIGMNEETQKRMFDKYFRGDKSRSTQGNGLGLSMVKKIADLLDLKIKVESQLNKGTSFTIIF
jgi:signal transduction histidine kinase